MKENYVTASLELLKEGVSPDTVLSNLTSTMKAAGHDTLLPTVLKELLKAYEMVEKNNTPTVIVSSAKEVNTKEVQAALEVIGVKNASPTIVIDDTIIGGSQVVYNHKLIDSSFKTQLHNLYKAALNA